MYFVWWIIAGLVAGWATGKLMKGAGYGVLMDISLGILGAIVGGSIVGALGLYPPAGLVSSILVAFLGSVAVVSLTRMLKRA